MVAFFDVPSKTYSSVKPVWIKYQDEITPLTSLDPLLY